MKRTLLVVIIYAIGIANSIVYSQTLKLNTYGDPKNEAIIFFHGGPGYNSVNFELSTAQKLANQGVYVIVYDRRGEGRETSKKSDFTFQQTFEDINQIYRELNVKKAHLFGHSFGGVIAAKFGAKYPKKVSSITLISSPISIQKTLQNIIQKSERIYIKKSDSINLGYIKYLKNMDSGSLSYSSYAFQHAIVNKFYSTEQPTKDAKRIYQSLQNNSMFKKYVAQSNYSAVKGFYDNEKYTLVNIHQDILSLISQNVKIKGIYGIEDGLFVKNDIDNLRKLIGKSNVIYFDKSSHNIFIDQQRKFINYIKENILND